AHTHTHTDTHTHTHTHTHRDRECSHTHPPLHIAEAAPHSHPHTHTHRHTHTHTHTYLRQERALRDSSHSSHGRLTVSPDLMIGRLADVFTGRFLRIDCNTQEEAENEVSLCRDPHTHTHTHTHWGKREARANFTVTMTLMANTKSTGVRSSCQNMRATGVHLVDSWTALQYAHRSRGKCRSQSHGWFRQQTWWAG